MAKGYVYTVQGTARFPLDMLRYDSAHPVSSESVVEIEESLFRNDPRKIRSIRLASASAPTEGRWSSFGWAVIKSSIQRT